jgi:hypothetical protein
VVKLSTLCLGEELVAYIPTVGCITEVLARSFESVCNELRGLGMLFIEADRPFDE